MRVERRRVATGTPRGRGEGGRGAALPAEGIRASSFLATLETATRPSPAEHEALLAAVDRAGELLRENPSQVHLEEYKRRVGELLRALSRSAFRVVSETGRVQSGRQRLFILVRAVNQELDELTRLVLARERDRLAIVAKLDQIRGLLVDLYR